MGLPTDNKKVSGNHSVNRFFSADDSRKREVSPQKLQRGDDRYKLSSCFTELPAFGNRNEFDALIFDEDALLVSKRVDRSSEIRRL